MHSILLVSPCFPPVNTPDMHRLRLSIPFLKDYGISYDVLAVEPAWIEASTDPVLEEHVHFEHVHHVKAFSTKVTRKFGLGNLGYRSVLQLRKAGNRLLKQKNYDLIYFSTTAFPVMTLGRYWKKRFGLPFVIDMQDPWRNDFYLSKPRKERPPKFFIAHRLNSILERRTMKAVDGIVSVSAKYPEVLQERYNRRIPHAVIPFSASERDFELLRQIKLKNTVFRKDDSSIYAVYTGALTPGMTETMRFLLKQFRQLSEATDLKIKLVFVGTSYGKGVEEAYRVRPMAAELGMEDMVLEHPERVGYFETLQILREADLIIFPGSVDPGYTASKVFPYILSRKPLFVLSNSSSSVAEIVERSKAGRVICFRDMEDLLSREGEVYESLLALLMNLPDEMQIDMQAFEAYTERTMVRKQIGFFRELLSENRK
ncbi:MAG: hypothetical protein CSA96_05200 [Bacteroidetes bacterium]|nr:MAG: hypothetical protein CSA96_05200 [Bacteroidota bacterium]